MNILYFYQIYNNKKIINISKFIKFIMENKVLIVRASKELLSRICEVTFKQSLDSSLKAQKSFTYNFSSREFKKVRNYTLKFLNLKSISPNQNDIFETIVCDLKSINLSENLRFSIENGFRSYFHDENVNNLDNLINIENSESFTTCFTSEKNTLLLYMGIQNFPVEMEKVKKISDICETFKKDFNFVVIINNGDIPSKSYKDIMEKEKISDNLKFYKVDEEKITKSYYVPLGRDNFDEIAEKSHFAHIITKEGKNTGMK